MYLIKRHDSTKQSRLFKFAQVDTIMDTTLKVKEMIKMEWKWNLELLHVILYFCPIFILFLFNLTYMASFAFLGLGQFWPRIKLIIVIHCIELRW